MIHPADFDLGSLVRLLLPYNWQRGCEIVASGTTGPVHVRHQPGPDAPLFLRYSRGPIQQYFWSGEGDDFKDVNTALLALSKAPPPLNFRGPVIPFLVEPEQLQAVLDQAR